MSFGCLARHSSEHGLTPSLSPLAPTLCSGGKSTGWVVVRAPVARVSSRYLPFSATPTGLAGERFTRLPYWPMQRAYTHIIAPFRWHQLYFQGVSIVVRLFYMPCSKPVLKPSLPSIESTMFSGGKYCCEVVLPTPAGNLYSYHRPSIGTTHVFRG